MVAPQRTVHVVVAVLAVVAGAAAVIGWRDREATATPAGPGAAAAGPTSVPFASPDGQRVVRLSLQGIAGSRHLPSLRIEYCKAHDGGDVLIRPFAAAVAATASAHYRVAWSPDDRRFAVLATDVPSRAADRAPRLPSGEFVLFATDRAGDAQPSLSTLRDDAWGIGGWPAVAPVALPLHEVDLADPREDGVEARVGTLTHQRPHQPVVRVQNLTVHPNTQNFVPGRLATTPALLRFGCCRSPTGGYEASLARPERTLGSAMVLLDEGDRFPDQRWVLLFDLPEARRRGARFVWTRDGRHLLLVSAPLQRTDFAPLPGSTAGEEVFLCFDTVQWNGEIAPAADRIARLDLAH